MYKLLKLGWMTMLIRYLILQIRNGLRRLDIDLHRATYWLDDIYACCSGPHAPERPSVATSLLLTSSRDNRDLREITERKASKEQWWAEE